MTGARCGAQTTETGSDGGEITFVCLLPAGHDGQQREPGDSPDS
jgi:hypothetical protein